ncbi:MAG: phosphoribosylaminoimidazolesuccinocarboxamide synthase [Acidobacteriota bacterium]
MTRHPELLWQADIPELPAPTRGKVRDVFDLGERLLIVATDRISAYDHNLRPGIPGKGKILNLLSNVWFARLTDLVPNHLVATDVDDFPAVLQPHADQLRDRAVVVDKADVVPYECVARGYLAGSGYRDYLATGAVCGVALPPGLERASRLPEPIFTPATKAQEGHDQNVSFEVMANDIGTELATRLRDLTLDLYRRGAELAAQGGLILADTKFELGFIDGELHLVDEVLTPDSSRYWDPELWQPGTEPDSFDKQYVRNWLDDSGWDHESPPPELSEEVVAGTLARYREAYERLV